MLVVNPFGIPGAGKSAGAAYVFSKLKMKGVNAELVTEYAKDMVWEILTLLTLMQCVSFFNFEFGAQFPGSCPQVRI